MASKDAAHEHDYSTGWGWLGISGLYTQYMWVWVWLAVLTIVEVFIPEPHIFSFIYGGFAELTFPRPFVIVSLIALALVKTWLVAWYYMHLIAEKPAIILVACAPFVFSVFLTVGIFPWAGG